MTHWLPDFWIVCGPPVHASTHPHTEPCGYSIKPSQKKRLPYATREQRNNDASIKYNKEKFA